ncbi:SDR family oxidoreductase [soil metagenome]
MESAGSKGKLNGQIAVVTGSDSGIGQATAIALAAEGASVVVNYLKDAKGAETTRQGVEEAGGKAIVVQGDVGEEAAVEAIFARCEGELGTATILINSAGVDAGGVCVADMTTESWEAALRTNLTGPFLTCRRFIKALHAAKSPGKIVNVTSVHQEIPRAGAAEYDASKGGLRNLTTTLALELAEDHINVNNLAPGMVLTPMNQEAIDDPKVLEEQVQSIPWKRAADPKEVARLAVYLASPDADYITGATFVIDGGLTLNLGQGA